MIFRVSSLSRVSQNAEARIVFDDEIERNQVSWKSSKTRTHYLKNHKSCNRRKQRQPRSSKDSSEAHYRDRKTDRQRYRQRYRDTDRDTDTDTDRYTERPKYRDTQLQRGTHTHTDMQRGLDRPGKAGWPAPTNHASGHGWGQIGGPRGDAECLDRPGQEQTARQSQRHAGEIQTQPRRKRKPSRQKCWADLGFRSLCKNQCKMNYERCMQRLPNEGDI